MAIRKTKIIATMGPASVKPKVLEKLIRSGVNVTRLNFSHGDHAMHENTLNLVRNTARKVGIPVAIVQDLSGPKIRTGDLYKDSIILRKGKKITLTSKKCIGTEEQLYINYKNLPREVKKGTLILLDDGRKKLKVLSVHGENILCQILVGGEIKGRRGVNLPGVSLKISSLTPKDREDVLFGIKHGVEFMALSFVRRASDVRELRSILNKHNSDIRIIAKIETHDAVEHIDEIVAEADGIMVARGDLAVEVPTERVPLIQKCIIKKCNFAGKPVIIATQMLESMINAPVPTRAEVSDVANSILDGADAIMLSAETAIGEYPVETVEMMSRAAVQAEAGYPHWEVLEKSSLYSESKKRLHTVDAITHHAVNIAHDVDARVIVALTETGSTARMISRYRPEQSIFVMSPNERTLGQVILTFGCYPVPIKPFRYVGEALERIKKILLQEKAVKKGDRIVVAAGVPFGKTGGTNLVMVHKI